MATAQLKLALDAVDGLLAAALDADAAPGALERVRDLFHGSKACTLRVGPDLSEDDVVTTNLDPALQHQCIVELQPELGFIAASLRRTELGSVHTSEELLGGWLERSRIRHEFMLPQNMYRGLSSRVLDDGDSLWFIDVQRGKGQPDFDVAERELLGRLVPVFRVLAQVQQHAGHLRLERDRARHVLDRVDAALLIVDGDGRLVHANHPGEDLVAQLRGSLTLRGGRILARHPADQISLRRLLGSAAAGLFPSEAGPCQAILGGGDDGSALISICVTVLPQAYGVQRHGREFLIAARPLRRGARLVRLGQNLFGLTEAEARIAACLAQGQTLADAAKGQSIRMTTARTHLARIFQKMEVRQQSQVVALLCSADLPSL